MVKLGLASEEARSSAEDYGHTASGQLLAQYSVTPAATPALRTPRTPANEDTILQEVHTLLALQNVETPLKGGENTPLHDSSFEGSNPKKQAVATPNVVLGTPFRTPSQVGPGSTPRLMQTPRGTATGAMTPGQTPIRDQLSINPEDSIGAGFEVLKDARQQQMEIRAQLRAGLSSLPAPRNDFEIVVPEDESVLEEAPDHDMDYVVDAAEIDEMKARQRKEEEEREWRRQSQAVQRDLPRPIDINASILRGAPHKDQKYRALYEVGTYSHTIPYIGDRSRH